MLTAVDHLAAAAALFSRCLRAFSRLYADLYYFLACHLSSPTPTALPLGSPSLVFIPTPPPQSHSSSATYFTLALVPSPIFLITVGWKNYNAARSVYASANNAAPQEAPGRSPRWKYTWSISPMPAMEGAARGGVGGSVTGQRRFLQLVHESSGGAVDEGRHGLGFGTHVLHHIDYCPSLPVGKGCQQRLRQQLLYCRYARRRPREVPRVNEVTVVWSQAAPAPQSLARLALQPQYHLQRVTWLKDKGEARRGRLHPRKTPPRRQFDVTVHGIDEAGLL